METRLSCHPQHCTGWVSSGSGCMVGCNKGGGYKPWGHHLALIDKQTLLGSTRQQTRPGCCCATLSAALLGEQCSEIMCASVTVAPSGTLFPDCIRWQAEQTKKPAHVSTLPPVEVHYFSFMFIFQC
jgi:hypothetical protein